MRLSDETFEHLRGPLRRPDDTDARGQVVKPIGDKKISEQTPQNKDRPPTALLADPA